VHAHARHAINVGDLSDREGVSYTMFGVAGTTLDAMMRASTRHALTAADVVINVDLEQYGSLDWRRTSGLIAEGYRAAEGMRDRLLPLALRAKAPMTNGGAPAWPDG
jgi:NTE family protein